mmetsp:Transcript_17478/g.37776  ORF Transcript_17478/g.37776 Transcript_17478/m.37776 type:complete len:104 (-) Transcript_17478:949-1260(-)
MKIERLLCNAEERYMLQRLFIDGELTVKTMTRLRDDLGKTTRRRVMIELRIGMQGYEDVTAVKRPGQMSLRVKMRAPEKMRMKSQGARIMLQPQRQRRTRRKC